MIPIEDCIFGRVYKIRCRNLSYGVYDGDSGFIGIRTKFGSRYLFTEYHWDAGAPFGTVRKQEDTGINVPNNINIKDHASTEELFKFLDSLQEKFKEQNE
jgi:hypothetical protein